MSAHHARGTRSSLAVGAALLLTLFSPPPALHAQTDYFNTDTGRPIRTEDAYPIERRAIELQIAPLRVERSRAGTTRWGIEPEIAVGLFPRTQIEVGLPLVHVDGARAVRTTSVAALYNFNAETRWPALALAVDVLLPAKPLGPREAIPSLKAIATRTFPWARMHVNAQVTVADDPSRNVGEEGVNTAMMEFSRWTTGVAIDKWLPLRSMLFTAEVVASQPLVASEAMRWDVAGGTRVQLSPRIAFDAGGGYRVAGEEPGWFLTTGAAFAIGMPWRNRGTR